MADLQDLSQNFLGRDDEKCYIPIQDTDWFW